MSYLPNELPKAKILIVVKTYPLPTRSYSELVSMAGLLNGEKWIRIYPVSFRFLQDQAKYPKYSWIEIDLIRNTKDFRSESYSPKISVDTPITVLDKFGTADNWAARKSYVLKEVFTSMNELIALAKDPKQRKSLATLKPSRIVDFVIEEDEPEWKLAWQHQLSQLNLFELPTQRGQKKLVKKLPYKFSYRFFSEDDKEPRKMIIEDWEIGELFWNCLYRTDGDEQAALKLVKQKYLEEFSQRDLYFFVSTTKQFHNIAPNPFVIAGVFYPPKTSQISLFENLETRELAHLEPEAFLEQKSPKPLMVFLCHSKDDKEIVRKLYWQLIKDNYDVWFDEEKLIPGQDWDLEIRKAVRSSDIVVICLSKNSVAKAGYIQKEIKFALDVADEQPEGSIFLIPARFEESNVPSRLSRYQWVNMFEENGYQKLKSALILKDEELKSKY